MTSHLPPFFCPYCGEEDIRPHGEAHGEWACGACRRVFVVRTVRPAGAAAGPQATGADADGAASESS